MLHFQCYNCWSFCKQLFPDFCLHSSNRLSSFGWTSLLITRFPWLCRINTMDTEPCVSTRLEQCGWAFANIFNRSLTSWFLVIKVPEKAELFKSVWMHLLWARWCSGLNILYKRGHLLAVTLSIRSNIVYNQPFLLYVICIICDYLPSMAAELEIDNAGDNFH